MADELDRLRARVQELEAAIRTHRDQKADDRCWLDDLELYKLLDGEVVPDNRVGDKFEMMVNCVRFLERRCEGGEWSTYRELEEQVAALAKELDGLKAKWERLLGKAASQRITDGYGIRRLDGWLKEQWEDSVDTQAGGP